MAKTILYLHGFMSTPLSFKAQLLKKTLQELPEKNDYICPQLPMSPAESIDIAMHAVSQCSTGNLVVIGSSLGGYYANWIAEQLHCKAVLLNPVIDPWKIKILEDSPDRSDLQVKAWLDFRETYQTELKALCVTEITEPNRYLLVAARGDELLDWRLMQAHYKAAHQIIIPESNHGISDFEQYISKVLMFCGLSLER